MWEEGLPYRSVKYGIIASRTLGSRGVVEIWSKKIRPTVVPRLLLDLELGHLVADQLDVKLFLIREVGEHLPHGRVLRLFRRLLVLPEILHLVPERQAQHLFHAPFRHCLPPRAVFRNGMRSAVRTPPLV